MFGKPAYNYSNSNSSSSQYMASNYPGGSPGHLSSVSSNSSSCSASALSSLVNLSHDINQELNQSALLNSAYNQVSMPGAASSCSQGKSTSASATSLSANGGATADPSSSLALSHAMSKYSRPSFFFCKRPLVFMQFLPSE